MTATKAMFQQLWLQRYFCLCFSVTFVSWIQIRIAYLDQDADPWSVKLTYHFTV